MHTNTFCKYRKNYSHRLACILLFIVTDNMVNEESAHIYIIALCGGQGDKKLAYNAAE